MFFKNKLYELNELFQRQLSQKLNEITKRYKKINITQAEQANSQGYLHDGKYACIFLNTHIDESTERLNAIYDIFKNVYLQNLSEKKYADLLTKKVLQFSISGTKGFERAVDSNNSIMFADVKEALKRDYKMKMGTIIGDLYNTRRIEQLKQVNFKSIFNEIDGEPPSEVKNTKWIFTILRKHKFVALLLIVLFFTYCLYSDEIKAILKFLIKTAIEFYF